MHGLALKAQATPPDYADDEMILMPRDGRHARLTAWASGGCPVTNMPALASAASIEADRGPLRSPRGLETRGGYGPPPGFQSQPLTARTGRGCGPASELSDDLIGGHLLLKSLDGKAGDGAAGGVNLGRVHSAGVGDGVEEAILGR